MSFYLVNPGGRTVVIDTKKRRDELVEQHGFKEANKAQIKKEKTRWNTFVKKQELGKQTAEGIDVYLATVSPGGKDGFGIASSKITQELRRIGVNVEPYNKGQKIALLFHNPYSVMRLENDYRMVYTMFESTRIPDDWKDYLEAADKVMVPSKWCQDVFKESGVETQVVPLGYDHNTFKFFQRKNKEKERKDFVFLHYNAFNVRKGFLELFKAWQKAFKPTDPVKLILKTTLRKIPLPITKREYPNIIIKTGNFNDQQLLDLLYEADAFVFPSRGEGFGMTPLEAMATGLPTIVPNAHGITEYFNPRYMYEVKVKETCPGIYSRYKNQDVGEMSVCDVDHLAKQMRYLYEHQDDALRRGKGAAKYVQKWTFENTARKLKGIFEGMLINPTPDRPLRNVLQLDKVK